MIKLNLIKNCVGEYQKGQGKQDKENRCTIDNVNTCDKEGTEIFLWKDH